MTSIFVEMPCFVADTPTQTAKRGISMSRGLAEATKRGISMANKAGGRIHGLRTVKKWRNEDYSPSMFSRT